jgi:segregation and condensation protein B
MPSNDLTLDIEALIFASDASIAVDDIRHVLETTHEQAISEKEVRSAIQGIKEKYADEAFAIELRELNGGYQFLTKSRHHGVINQLQLQRSKKKLSQAAMETLAIIAYRQPITKLEVEQIRGVNCDYTIQRLLEKELISIAGKGDGVGRPILYATSPLFMDYFGLNSTADLPQLKDLASNSNEIGENEQ